MQFPTANPTKHGQCIKRSFPGPSLTTVLINIEGLTPEKETILVDLCKDTKFDVLCVQETHRAKHHNRPKVNGIKMVVERPHQKYGSVIFVRSDINIISTNFTENKDIEILTVDIGKNTITSIYNLPSVEFEFIETKNFRSKDTKFIIGDFNSHSVQWGYRETDENGTH